MYIDYEINKPDRDYILKVELYLRPGLTFTSYVTSGKLLTLNGLFCKTEGQLFPA